MIKPDFTFCFVQPDLACERGMSREYEQFVLSRIDSTISMLISINDLKMFNFLQPNTEL